MAKVVYVNVSTGSDANSGLTPLLAKASIAGASGARSVLAAGDRISVAAGVYLEPDVTWNSANDVNVVVMADGSGPVIIDFANRPTVGQHWLTTVPISFISLWFRNPGTVAACVASFSLATVSNLINCVLYQKDGAANTGGGATRSSIENCSFFNLATGYAPSGASGMAFNNYFKSCTTPISGTATRDFNALPGNTEANGINSSITDPGFVNSSLEDFRLDPSTIPSAYQTYMSSGRWRGRIGATGTSGIYYDSRFAQTRMFSTDPVSSEWPVWENDPTYVASGVLGAIIQDPTTNEVVLDLNTTPNATDGRMRSEVIDAGVGYAARLGSVSIPRFEDRPAGSAIDTNTTLPAHWEYRSSGVAFLKGDVLPAWSPIQATDNISTLKRYLQLRVTFRMDHSGS